ncbi:hypothetical protein IKG29_02300 [Candidatus Saccharibacteria bacterium]|nr:hypothetical protein [Candidatus Saccharibacteria bacterium]
MKRNKLIKSVLFSLAIIFSINLFATLPTFADDAAGSTDICGNNSIPAEIRAASGCAGTSVTEPGVIIGSIVSTIVGILGLVAVIFILVGGVQYMTSAGDPGKTKKAKDTILYACIGLVVCVLAFAITQFTINAIKKANGENEIKKDDDTSYLQNINKIGC